MAMSWVADAVVKRSNTAHSRRDGCAASCGTTAIVASPRTTRQTATQCWRTPNLSTNGAQSIFSVHGRESRLINPISASETPCTRKYTGQTS
jgi:hypothetical protein